MTLKSGQVAYWKCDETAGNITDSNSGYVLLNKNSVPLAAGKINNGLNFGSTNTNKYFIGPAVHTYYGSSGTISFWVNMQTAPTSGNTQTFMEVMDDATSSFMYVEYRNVGGTLKLAMGRSRYNVANDEVLVTTTLTIGTWYLITVTYDGTTVTGYINATSQGTTTSSGNGSGLPSYQTVIGSYLGTSNFVTATMDEIGVWNRALTSTEVTALYNSGSGSQYPFGLTNIIDVDFTLEPAGGSSVTSYSFTHFCAGSNRILIVGVIGDNTSDNITGVNCNGIPMKGLGKIQVSGDRYNYLYYLVNPLLGANIVTVNSTGTGFIIPGSVSYSGVSQTSPINVSGITSGTGTTLSNSLTTTVNNCWMVSTFRSASAVTPTGITVNRIFYQAGNSAGIADSGGAVATGSVTLGETSSSTAWAMIAAAMAPATFVPGVLTNLSAISNISSITI